METEIRQYVRDNHGNRRGVMLGKRYGEIVRVSWSFCNKKDKFDAERGLSIARNRLDKGTNAKMPRDVKIFDFMNRCERYFKTDRVYYAYYGEKDERCSY